ncbi:copper resistance protein CopC [Nonomuraea sp. NPDC050022]|uniref:copper resistance protein CopC n=1 Tax=Nonomuraea sp. NPDC050022 TaxID=3364358 RepID=UPI0037B4FFC9
MRRLVVILLLAFAGVGVALPARAHNVLVGSDPKDGATLSAAPGRITLVFDQAVRQGYAQVGVTGADGTAWADGTAEVAAEKVSIKVKPLRTAGAYVVGYRILSADGHPVTGKIGFTLAAGATAVQEGAATQDAVKGGTGDAGAEAAEAAANGGAGMAVVWIVGALLVLAAGTAVSLRRARTPAPADSLTSEGEARDGEARDGERAGA